MINYVISHEVQDGKLLPTDGRIIMYDGLGIKSNSSSEDHNDLLRAFSAKYRIPRDEVISNAMRFYWRRKSNGIAICPVRRIDEEWIYRHLNEFNYIVDSLWKR